MAALARPASVAGAAPQVLHDHVPPVVKRLTPLGRPEPSQRLRLAIALPLRNQTALAGLLKDLYDPASPRFHHYLTPSQFAESFGPNDHDFQSVIAFAKAHGLTVTTAHPNRLILDVEGELGAIEKTFRVNIRTYQHPTERRTFYAPDREPSLDLTVPILHISGLDTYSLPRPLFKPAPRAANAGGALAGAANATPDTGSGPSGGYMGNDFRTAYVPGVALTGMGQTVGLLQFDGYTLGDITYYESRAGRSSVTLTNVLLDGFNGEPTGNGGEVEVSLDIEMVISMAPSISNIIVYEAGPSGVWHDILNRMATDNLAKQLSCSWYIPDGTMDPVADQIFQEMAAQGQSFFCASGDSDAFTGLIPFPGDTPYITEVGGTTLSTSNAGGPWSSETVWNWGNGSGSGGGISTQYALPSWQQGISMAANQGSTTRRNVPDVALTADNVYVRADGANQNVGGTSCAAPLWAGFTALVNQQAAANGRSPVGFINPAVYAIGTGSGYGAAFHDIATGNNFSTSSPSRFSGVAGYDLCTGWGTPLGAGLITALAGPTDSLQVTGVDLTANGPVGGSFTPAATTYTLTNNGAASLNWTASSSQAWLTISPTGGALTPGASTPVTVAFNSAAAALAIGGYAATLTFNDATSGINQVHSAALTVNPLLGIVPASLPAATANAAYSQVIAVSGGTTPYAALSVSGFSGGTTGLTAGAITANTTAGRVAVSGMPAAAGVAVFTVNVTDGAGATLAQPYSITVNSALGIAPAILPGGTVGAAYAQAVTVSGGTLPYTTISATNFNGGATGLTAAAITASAAAGTVTVSGTPAAAGIANFTINVTDSAGAALIQGCTFGIFGNGPPEPQIDVEQPAGTVLSSGASSVGFVSSGVGSGAQQTFTVRNYGNAPLTIAAVTFDGVNAGDFSLTTAPASTLVSLSSTTFVVTFIPSVSTAESAALHIACNDPNTNPFTVTLAGSVQTGIVFVTDQAAETVVGEPSFIVQSTTVNQMITPGPTGCAISSTGQLAICDQTASRVLIWNSIPTTNGQPADVVVGKASFTDTSTTPSASITGACNGVDFSPSGQLIVADSTNNRVLVWNTVPMANGTPADVVIGQTSFNTASLNTSSAGFNSPEGVLVTPAGQLLVADFNNNRVLIYNSIPTTNGASANLVIGQTGMTTASNGNSASQLYHPWGLAMSSNGSLFIADSFNNRVLLFNSVPNSNGASAALVIGQSAFGVSASGTSATTLNDPTGVAVSPYGQIAIADHTNNRVLIYDAAPIADGVAADAVLGQPNFTTGAAFYGGISSDSISSAHQPAYAADGRLLVPGKNMNRLMIFGPPPNPNAPVILSSLSAGGTVGQPFNYQIVATNSPTSFGASGLPAGFSFDANSGMIVGVPSATGTYFIQLSATNASGVGASTLALTINPVLAMVPGNLPAATVAAAYSATVTVTGGTTPYASFVLSDFNGGTTGLTAGEFAINAAAGTASITGAPTAAGTATFTLTVTDAAGATLSQIYGITVNPALSISPSTLPNGTVNAPYTETIAVTGGTAPYGIFSVTGFNGGATGLTAAAITANATAGTVLIDGRPNATGLASFTVNVKDTAGATLTQSYTVAVFNAGPPAPQLGVQQPAGTILASGVGAIGFNSAGFGDATAQTFTITNSGNATLNLSGVTFSGAYAGDFSLSVPPASTVASLGSTTFTVAYAPTTAGGEIATLQIASNDPTTNPFTITLFGFIPTGIIFPTDEAALTVIGQANFTSQSLTVNQTTTPGPTGCAISFGGQLAICDQTASRVLLWNSVPTANGQAANVVVGKAAFTGTVTGASATLMYGCGGVAFSPAGQLLVADSYNNRVLIWNTVPTSNGTAANVVIGQSSFTAANAGLSASQLNNPVGLAVTPAGQLLIADSGNNRVLVFSSIPTTNGAAANLVIGQSTMSTGSSGNGANQLSSPSGLAVTGSGGLLIADANNNRVLIFNSIPTSNGAAAQGVIGQTAFGLGASGLSAAAMSQPLGVAISPAGQLAVSDSGNNRVLIYNSVPTLNGAAADSVLGQSSFTSGAAFAGGIGASSMSSAYQPAFAANGQLLIPGKTMSRVMVFGQPSTPGLPVITSATSASAAEGQPFSYQIAATYSPNNYSAGGLPAGLSLNSATGLISGMPAVAGTFSIALSADNPLGAGSATLVVSIAPALANLALSPGVLTPAFSSGIAGYTATASDLTPSITITPTAVDSASSITVNAAPVGSGGSTAPIILAVGPNTIVTVVRSYDGSTQTTYTITVTRVNAPPANLTYSVNPAAYTLGLAIAPNTPSVAGGPIASFSVSPPLPAGLSLDPIAGAITGTPTAVTASAGYTVTAANNGGSTTASVIIAVNDVPPSALAYAVNPANYPLNATIIPNTPSHRGGSVLAFSISPPLPAGLALDPVAGVISGAPTALASAANYTVKATNSGGSATAVLNLAVTLAVQSWLQQWFGASAGSGDMSDLGDFDHNGIPNVVKYAFGLNPTVPSSMQLPPLTMSGGTCGFNFTEPVGVTGLVYAAEYSSDLTEGVWTSIPDTGSAPNHIFSMPIAGYGHLFLRLTVTEQ